LNLPSKTNSLFFLGDSWARFSRKSQNLRSAFRGSTLGSSDFGSRKVHFPGSEQREHLRQKLKVLYHKFVKEDLVKMTLKKEKKMLNYYSSHCLTSVWCLTCRCYEIR
jgi:hypothetical protein